MLGAPAASPIRSRGVGVVRWWAAEARRRGGRRRPVSVSRSSARSFGTRSRSVLTASEASSEDARDAPNPSHPPTLGVNASFGDGRRSRVCASRVSRGATNLMFQFPHPDLRHRWHGRRYHGRIAHGEGEHTAPAGQSYPVPPSHNLQRLLRQDAGRTSHCISQSQRGDWIAPLRSTSQVPPQPRQNGEPDE